MLTSLWLAVLLMLNHTAVVVVRILVLADGHVAEFDQPQTLLNDSSSLFYGLAKDAGLV